MSAKPNLPSLKDIVWTKPISKNGAAYEIGATKAAAEARKNALGATRKIIKASSDTKSDINIALY